MPLLAEYAPRGVVDLGSPPVDIVAAMSMMNGVHDGDLSITEDTEVNGVVTGDLFVRDGRVNVNGVVRGSVHATGGTVTITGNVHGRAWADGGTVRVAVGALVNGRVLDHNKGWTRPGGAWTIDAATPVYDITELDL